MSTNSKTGIVIVSYNAADALKATLASVRRAHNETQYKLILVDNASEPGEQKRIQEIMQAHQAEIGESWVYIEQVENLGFSGGNNIGIAAFMEDPEIGDICLLNSDVIVTDHWLDRMLAYDKDMISSATNRADGEQCIPVDYSAQLEEFLSTDGLQIPEAPYQRVQDFAERWHSQWQGNLIEADVTFFCVLFKRRVVERIGLLDDTFFPGGFEDDDYCLRARDAGFSIYLARDVYIHHWGSASFGKLQYEYFSERAKKNMAYLEQKHDIRWQRRSEKPIVSYACDLGFTLSKGSASPEQQHFLELHVKNVTRQVKHFEQEFTNLSSSLRGCQSAVPEQLAKQTEQAGTYGNLLEQWTTVVNLAAQALKTERGNGLAATTLLEKLNVIAAGIHDRVDCNFAIHSFLSSLPAAGEAPLQPPTAYAPAGASAGGKLARLRALGNKAWTFIRQFDGIVFFGGYFYPERQSDGYFQRIQIVDRLFSNHWRVYVESEELRGRSTWFDRPEPNVIVLRVTGSRLHKWAVRVFAGLAALRCRRIYFHSVLRMQDNRFGLLMHVPFIRKAIDIHGVVPEEFRMHNDFYSAVMFDRHERLAVKKAGLAIVVTNAMRLYLQQKFRTALEAKTLEFPMFPSFAPYVDSRPLEDGKPVIVYAGGLHKWQQTPKMIDAIVKTADHFQHRFYCPEPDTVKAMLPNDLLPRVVVEQKTHAQLMKLYTECHYGFILREDNIVNRVACPTKLVEYLAMGIIPIVDCEDIGDFKALGMKYVTLNDVLCKRLPNEKARAQMAADNLQIYDKLKSIRNAGAQGIYDYFVAPRASQDWTGRTLQFARRVLAPDTLAGKVARKAWRHVAPFVRKPTAAATPQPSEVLVASECDLLVQVENFEAGGLENVVIDLNNTLVDAGYRVTLLVLGNEGPAVQEARNRGLDVLCQRYAPATHARTAEQLNPKIVIGHYCSLGIEHFHARGIPYVQVIHNIYMWFDDAARNQFAQDAELTNTLVAVSQQVRQYSVARLGAPAEKCTVIANGIDVDRFKRFDAVETRSRHRKHFGFTDEHFVFIEVGAINHQKNHIATLRAFRQVVERHPQARLLILGPVYEAPLLKEMEDYIAAHGLNEMAIYGGSVPAIQEYLTLADAFVAGTFFEGCQLSLLEALVANLPVVTSNVGHASAFGHNPGVKLVTAPIEMASYDGAIWQMKSGTDFDDRLAQAMIDCCDAPTKPDLNEEELAMLDRRNSYQQYVQLVAKILQPLPGTSTSEAAGTATLAEPK
ncbi:glycosyltransferase [Pseudomonas putida]|uniref:glycosyltransferase family 2 protein n=1 Tax=Pseudomonas putida TaxID=303 RepID=UPI00125EC4F9|nr:glycosyltransferase [Pseudomonas putida]KAB5619174.1 glycosyltransferase [Pseudomonas putida]